MSTTAAKAWKDLTERQKLQASIGAAHQRVDQLARIEAALRADFGREQERLDILSRGFFGRLRWLFSGK